MRRITSEILGVKGLNWGVKDHNIFYTSAFFSFDSKAGLLSNENMVWSFKYSPVTNFITSYLWNESFYIKKITVKSH